ncbi:hypothetical protein MJO28_002262 [Puccinia striiformis f. sp. tritici]|uniref:Uncharacterized protein n=1 Tax=Puccinia striiformis f. sp. tritici TaxID=168172 RepID=A0ACC0EY65_9BASI|nr:hypothetical protein MJO28_002262 [Puccinia striiformis f. sp. tritici]
MAVLSKKTFFYLAWHVLGPGRHVLANLDRAAGSSMSLQRLDASKTMLDDSLEPPRGNEPDLSQCGSIPQRSAARKGELKAMKSGYQEIQTRVNSLNPPLRLPFFQVAPRLKQLHSSLKPYIQDRVFRLSGVGSAFTSLHLNTVTEHSEHVFATAPTIVAADPLAPDVVRSSKDKHLPTPGNQASERSTPRSSLSVVEAITNALNYLNKLSSYMTTRKEPSPSAPLILGGSSLGPTMIQRIASREYSLTNRLLQMGQAGTSEMSQAGTAARSLNVLADHAIGNGARSKNLTPQTSGNTDALDEARLASSKGIIIDENLSCSNSLQETIVGSHSEDHAPRETSSIVHYWLHPNESQTQPTGHYPSTRPLVPSPGETATSTSNVLKSTLVGSGTPTGRLAIDHSAASGELYGDVLDIVKEFLADDEIQMWNYVEGKLLFFASGTIKPITREEGKCLLKFLQTFFLLGDYIYTYRLLPPQFLKNIKIFRLPYISSIIELQVAVMFLNSPAFFNTAESIIPQMHFLTTGRSLKHLHRSMKVIPAQHHMYLVHPALREIFRHTEYFVHPNISSRDFSQIRSRFCEDAFFMLARRLSSALRTAPDMTYRAQDGSLSVVNLIDDMIKFFQDPPRLLLSDKERIEFQIIFYSLDFFDKYFHPILNAMTRRRMISPLFTQQLDYMRSFLKFFPNQFQDPSLYQYFKQDQPFMKMYRDRSADNESLRQWIKTVPLALFPHIKMPSRFGIRRSPKFSMWMCDEI